MGTLVAEQRQAVLRDDSTDDEGAALTERDILHRRLYAIGCLQYILQDGLRVPEDISLISIDDIILSRYVTPRLTTVKIDRQELARQSIALLVDRMSGVPSLPEHIEVPCGEIEVRQNVCAHI